MRRINNYVFVCMLCFLLISCKEGKSTLLLPQDIDYKYSITYNKDTIIIEKNIRKSKDAYPFFLYFSNGEYYDDEGILYLSTKKDTVFERKDRELHDTYIIEIKKDRTEKVFHTTIYRVIPGGNHKVMTYYYDTKYHIVKIEVNGGFFFQVNTND